MRAVLSEVWAKGGEGGKASVAVAAACSLNNRFQRGQSTEDTVKVKIHTGLNALGCHNPAGQPGVQPPVDLRDQRPAMGGAQVGGQEKYLPGLPGYRFQRIKIRLRRRGEEHGAVVSAAKLIHRL